MPVFEKTSEIAGSAEEVFDYHARKGALARLTPPFMPVRNVSEIESLVDGARATLELSFGPLWMRVVAVHHDVQVGRSFVDVMEEGPFRSWKHEHVFTPLGADRSTLTDRVTWELPRGQGLGAGVVERRLARTFTHRHATTRRDFELFRALPHAPMTVGITGASGLVGTELSALLRVGGHTVVPLVRRPPSSGEGRWDPETGALELPCALDAVVHLAGEPIAGGRLTAAHAERVRKSRVDATTLLIDALARQSQAPRVFVGASAVGFYGDRGDDVLDDDAPRGAGVLADICAAWEDATRTAQERAMRSTIARIGVVLSPAGGALKEMLPAFRAGAGARFGSGAQWMPLIGIDDVGAIFYRALMDDRVEGVVNTVDKEPVSNAALTQTLAHVLHRPALLSVPRFAARALFGKAFADEALFGSARAVPRRLLERGHVFRHADIEAVLRHVLGAQAGVQTE